MATEVRHDQRIAHGVAPSDAARLYEQYSARILAYCHHVLRDPGDAEDAVQTTFLYAHRALERGVSPESESAWLHAIARNACRSLQRTAVRRGLVTGLDLDLVPGRDCGDDDARELAVDLGRALAAMPDGQRRALVMREWQGLPVGEIASQLGLSAPATYGLLTRARRSLARALSVNGRRPALALDFGAVFLKLKGLLAGGAAKTAAATVVVAGVALGGVTVERAVVGSDASPQVSRDVRGSSAFMGGADRIHRLTRRSRAVALPTPRKTPSHTAAAVRRPEDIGRSETFVRAPGSAAPISPTPPGSPGDADTTRASEDPSDSGATDAVSDAVSDVSELADAVVQDVIREVSDAGADLAPLPEPPLLEEDDPLDEDALGDVLPDPPPLPESPLP